MKKSATFLNLFSLRGTIDLSDAIGQGPDIELDDFEITESSTLVESQLVDSPDDLIAWDLDPNSGLEDGELTSPSQPNVDSISSRGHMASRGSLFVSLLLHAFTVPYPIFV